MNRSQGIVTLLNQPRSNPQQSDDGPQATPRRRPRSRAGRLIPKLARLLTDLRADMSAESALPSDSDGHHQGRPATPPPDLYVFRQVGEVWNIHYGGIQFAVRDSKGMRYLDHLLHYPRREFNALELVSLLERKESGKKIRKGHITDDNLRISDRDADLEILDSQAKKNFKQHLDDLKEQFEEAEEFKNIEKMAKIEEEQDWLLAELKKAHGFQGHSGTMPSNLERARTAVYKAVMRAINKIDIAHPPLGQHLRASIKTGATCAYRPVSELSPSWD